MGGLFLGLLCLVGGIIILIIFFVMKDSPEYKGQMFWIYSGAEIIILMQEIARVKQGSALLLSGWVTACVMPKLALVWPWCSYF